MQVFESELELLQNTADTRFGGDVEAMGQALIKLEERLEGRGKHFYRKVGNNCIIWSYCGKTIEACEENPDKLQGVFVTDFGTIIQPGAVVIGSMIWGGSEIIRGTKIRNSNIGSVRYISSSTITESYVSIGPVSRSVIDRTYTSADVAESRLSRCVGMVGRIVHENKQGVYLNNSDKSKDLNDNGAGAARLLADRGIRLAPDWVAPPIQ